MNSTTVYTMAPEAADYSQTRTVETFEVPPLYKGGKATQWRKVVITTDPYRTAYQCDRYSSFLNGVSTLDDPRTVPLGEGRPAPSNRRN